MTLEHKTTHADEVPGLLIEVLKEKPKFLAWILSYVNRVQELEDAIWDVYIGRFLDNAVGVQLDGLGEIVGAPRNGRDDETYRVRLRVQIRLNYGSGRGEDIIAAFQLVLQESTQFLTLRESYPAELTLDLRATFSQAVVDELLEILGEAKGAAIRAQLRYYLQPLAQTFRFSTSSTPTLNSARGFSTATVPSGFIDVASLDSIFGTGLVSSFAKAPDSGETTGRTVAVGSAGVIAYSDDDGATWTQAVSPFGAGNPVIAVKWGGGAFIAVGSDQIARSTDGLSWSSVYTPAIGFLGVLYNASATNPWVAFGSGASVGIVYSADGITWHNATSAFTVDTVCGTVTADGHYVVAGNAGKLQRSSDGSSWSTVTSTFGSSNIIAAAADATGRVVIAGAGGTLAASTNNASSFTSHASNLSGNDATGIAYGNGTWIVFALGGKISSSPDASTWTARTSTFGSNDIYAGTYDPDDGVFVVGGLSGEGASSSDGSSWSSLSLNLIDDAAALAYADGVFFASGNGKTTRALGGQGGGKLAGAKEST